MRGIACWPAKIRPLCREPVPSRLPPALEIVPLFGGLEGLEEKIVSLHSAILGRLVNDQTQPLPTDARRRLRCYGGLRVLASRSPRNFATRRGIGDQRSGKRLTLPDDHVARKISDAVDEAELSELEGSCHGQGYDVEKRRRAKSPPTAPA